MRRAAIGAVGLLALSLASAAPIPALTADRDDAGTDPATWARRRADFGFPASSAFMKELLQNPGLDMESYGLPLLPNEVAKLDERGELLDDADQLTAYIAEHSAAFGGVYFDGDKDRLVVMAVDGAQRAEPSQWDDLVPRGIEVSVRTAQWSLRELNDELDRVVAELAGSKGTHLPISYIAVDQRANGIKVVMDDPSQSARDAVRAVQQDIPITIIDGPRFTGASCSRLGACSPLEGGIGVKNDRWLCSAAFIARYPGNKYLVSAGHCDMNAGNTYKLNNGTTIGTLEQASWGNGTSADALIINVPEQSTDNWLYLSTTAGTRSMTARKANSGQITGGTACRSARSGYTCGSVADTNVYLTSVFEIDGINYPEDRVHQWIANFDSPGGDSGGAMFFGSSWYGVVGAHGGGNTSYSTVSYVESVLTVTACTSAYC